MPTTTRLDVQPIAGALGAEISGVDLGGDLDDATIAEIRRALLEHCVIFFRDQEFDAEQHKRLARRFGEIFVHPNYAGTQADPEIVMIRREPGDTRVVGEDWHTDTTMMPKPCTRSRRRPMAATRSSPTSTGPTRHSRKA